MTATTTGPTWVRSHTKAAPFLAPDVPHLRRSTVTKPFRVNGKDQSVIQAGSWYSSELLFFEFEWDAYRILKTNGASYPKKVRPVGPLILWDERNTPVGTTWVVVLCKMFRSGYGTAFYRNGEWKACEGERPIPHDKIEAWCSEKDVAAILRTSTLPRVTTSSILAFPPLTMPSVSRN